MPVKDLIGMPWDEVLKLKYILVEGIRFPCEQIGQFLHVLAPGYYESVDFLSNTKELAVLHLELCAVSAL